MHAVPAPRGHWDLLETARAAAEVIPLPVQPALAQGDSIPSSWSDSVAPLNRLRGSP